MREPIYESDDEWRTVVILNLVGLRQSIAELGSIVAIIAVGAFAAQWWENAPIVGALLAMFIAIGAFGRATKDYKKLAALHFEADVD
jgi:hypothetical protein